MTTVQSHDLANFRSSSLISAIVSPSCLTAVNRTSYCSAVKGGLNVAQSPPSRVSRLIDVACMVNSPPKRQLRLVALQVSCREASIPISGKHSLDASFKIGPLSCRLRETAGQDGPPADRLTAQPLGQNLRTQQQCQTDQRAAQHGSSNADPSIYRRSVIRSLHDNVGVKEKYSNFLKND
jgi:hypothetical protein